MLAALVCLCMLVSAAYAQSPNLISEEMIIAETVNYAKTAVVEEKVFERSYNASASEYYPYTYTLGVDVNNASFVEYHVTRRQEVHAGDVLATFTLDIDDQRLTSTQLALERAQRDYEEGIAQRLEEIDQLLEKQLEVRDPYERELMNLRIKRARLSCEQYCYQQESLIESYQEQLEEMHNENSQTQLIAPVDGIVSDLTFKRAGERVYANETLVTLYREEGMLMAIDNRNLNFRYGMPVTVTSGAKTNLQTFQGRVVAADDLVPESRRQGYALIELAPVAPGEEPRFSRLSVCGVSQYLENVMVIPRRCAKLNGGKYYVECLVNGSPQKRCVNIGLMNNTDTWILQGLAPGDVVIAD